MAELEFPTNALLDWYRLHKRDLPWRQTNDPYKIWISEVMCQQTRVDQAIPYYHRFLQVFPDVNSLASATQHELMQIWEGLGYYSRALNLHHAAKTIVSDYKGKIPHKKTDLEKLKGIGSYTSAAILSIAFNQPYAVVDGNVIRVLSRFYGITDDVSRPDIKKLIQSLADNLIPESYPGDFNQGLMELGATICKPTKPDCSNCPVQNSCIAYQTAKTDIIPYKTPKKKIPHYHIVVGVIRNSKGEVLISLRPANGMLGGLWEFPGGKVEPGETHKQALIREVYEEIGIQVNIGLPIVSLKHTYSHFRITLYAYNCKLESGTLKALACKEIKWVQVKDLTNYPFPKANRLLTNIIMEGH